MLQLYLQLPGHKTARLGKLLTGNAYSLIVSSYIAMRTKIIFSQDVLQLYLYLPGYKTARRLSFIIQHNFHPGWEIFLPDSHLR